MYAKTLAEQLRAYLDLQSLLEECRADGKDTAPASASAARARREILDALEGRPDAADVRPLADAARVFLDAEHQFDKASAAGGDLDADTRQMEGARRELERQIHAASGADVQEVRARRVVQVPAAPCRRRRILVAYDESAQARYALDAAVTMAQDAGGELMLLTVVRPATGAGGEYACSLERLDVLHHREADKMLAKVRLDLPRSVPADQMVREGLPAEEIVTLAKAWEADVIVMGTRARGRLTQFLLGSTAEAVIRRAPCPVMAVGRKVTWNTKEGLKKSETSARLASAVAAP